MASRATLRTWLRYMLGADSDDPAFSDAILNVTLQQAYHGLVAEILQTNPAYTAASGALTAASSTSHTYNLGVQYPTFARWLEVRFTDGDGSPLSEARLDELTDSGGEYFAIVGEDSAAQLVTSADTEAGTALWIRYAAWPAEWTQDSDTPALLPVAFHEVVALEALFAFGLGGEQRRPPELTQRWVDRRAQLFAHIGRRGVQPSRTRLDLWATT